MSDGEIFTCFFQLGDYFKKWCKWHVMRIIIEERGTHYFSRRGKGSEGKIREIFTHPFSSAS